MEECVRSTMAVTRFEKNGKNFFEALPKDIFLKIMEQYNLSMKDRVRLTCVSKNMSTLGLKDWTSVDIDAVATHHMPLVLNFLNRLGLHDAETLKHIGFPYSAALQSRVPGCLIYRHFKALTSLDFGITPTNLPRRRSHCWALCPMEIQSLSSLKNLKRLRATSLEDINAPFIDLEAFACLQQLTALTLSVEYDGPRAEYRWPGAELSKKLIGLVHLRSLELLGCDVIVNEVLQRLSLALAHMDFSISNPDNERFDVPQLTSAKLTGCDPYRAQIFPLRVAHNLQSLDLNGHLPHEIDYFLLPALTHLTWNDTVEEFQNMERIAPLAGASKLKSLSLGSYTPGNPGEISEIQEICPSLEALQINDLGGTDFAKGFFQTECMRHLRKLIVTFDCAQARNKDVCLRLDEKTVPALQHLEVRPCHFLEHLEHSKLEVLKIESNHSYDQHPTILLGKLPALKRFHLRLRIEKLKDSIALAAGLTRMPNVEDVYIEDCSDRQDQGVSMDHPVFEASRDWRKIEKLELVNRKHSIWLQRQLLERLKHLGLVCKSLTIPPACYPIPVQSLCIQTNAAAANHTILKQELAACDGMVVRQLNVDAEYKSKRVQHQIAVMQAYRHDYKLPDKDWLPQSKELLSIMKARLTPI